MTTTEPQMKPQDVVIYKLGELGGQMTAVQASVTQSATIQAAESAENKKEHAEFWKTLEVHAGKLATIEATKPARVVPASPWQKAAVIASIPATLLAVIAFIVFASNSGLTP